MSLGLKKILPFLTLAFAMVAGPGCVESAEDAARKPDIVENMIDGSIKTFKTGPVNESQTNYAQRLRKVLMDVDTEDLETLRDHHIAIGLDQRLSKQDNGFFDTYISGVFYNVSKDTGLVTLWDNGSPESSFWNKDTYDYGDDMIEDLAETLRDGDIPPKEKIAFAGQYGKYSYTDWDVTKDFDKDSIEKNPELQNPPVKKTSPGIGR